LKALFTRTNTKGKTVTLKGQHGDKTFFMLLIYVAILPFTRLILRNKSAVIFFIREILNYNESLITPLVAARHSHLLRIKEKLLVPCSSIEEFLTRGGQFFE
jgi:hypothetical protein